MTEDYKNKILDYITNNVTPETESNIPIFTDNETINKSVSNDIRNELNQRFVYSGYLCERNTQNILIYGYTDESGFIYLMDKNLNKIAMITTFQTGSKLFKIRELRQDENGYLYGVSVDDSTIRILLLNNIFAKQPDASYQVVLRKSYILPNTNNYKFNYDTVFWYQKNKLIQKTPDKATYYLIVINKNTNRTEIVKFTINVDTENEWIFKSTNINSYVYDFLIQKNEDNEDLYFYSNDSINNFDTMFIYSLKEDNLVLEKSVPLSLDPDLIFAKSLNEIYIGGSDFEVTYSIIEKYNGTYVKVIDKYTSDYSLNMYYLDNIIYLRLYTTSLNSITKIGILQDDVLYFSDEFNSPSSVVTFFIMKSYNLSIIYIATGTSDNMTTTKFMLDYNPLNYNGQEYVGYSQTIPKKARLYSANELIFARNLYNVTLLNSTATSTLEVPNTLLNDVDIASELLISDTNLKMNNQLLSISKNIYETLYLNFINTLNVIDEDTNTQYPSVANYINKNIYSASKENCESSFIGIVAINYSSSTIYQNVIWNYVTDHYETSFVINATDEVPTLTFMSNDLSTVYLTKELSIESGNYYLVSQKLRIE